MAKPQEKKQLYNIKNLTNNPLISVNWDTVSSWECSHIDGTFLSTSTDTTDSEKAILEKLVKWKNSRVYKSVDYNNQKLILLTLVYSSKIVNGNKKTKARLVAKGY